MGIQQVSIQGFRSFRSVDWKPGRLNVIIGPNASGKSNLLRALALLQHAATGDLAKEVATQGGMGALLWDGQARSLAWKVRTDPVRRGGDAAREALTYDLQLRQLGATSGYRVEYELLGNFYLKDAGEKASPKKFLERDPSHAVTFAADERKLVPSEGSIADDQTLLAVAGGPFGNPVVTAFRDSVLGWTIYHDLHVDQDAPLRRAAVARLDARVAPDGQNLVPVLHTHYTGNRGFKRGLDDAMRAAFGDDYEELVFPPDPADQRIQLRLRWRSLKTAQPAPALSDGTVRFLLLVAILTSPDIGDLIALDEPEAGLHPRMFPVIAELAQEAATRSQVIVTTHSPEFLSAFSGGPPVTTLARTVDGATDLAVVDGEELKRWLREYSFGELARTGEIEGLV